MTGNKIFATRIKECREHKKISQEELASLVGYTKQAVSQWENLGKVPREKTLRTLADYFKKSVDYLLGHSNDASDYPRNDKQNKERKNDIAKFLEKGEIWFHDLPLNEAEMQMVRNSLEAVYLRAKELNKRKKEDESN